MRYMLFGRSGLRVSELCLGAMTFGDGSGYTADRAGSQEIFDAFAEAGGTFVDTASSYADGKSEVLLGEFIRSDRNHFVVSTKYTQMGEFTATGNSRRSMIVSVERSLKRMQIEHIDLLWLHIWDFTTPIEELMAAFEHLVSSGKVHYVGASNMPAWEVSRGNMLADLRGWAPFIGLQIEYNLLARTVEREYLPMARKLDLGVVAWSPLATGLLSRPYDPDEARKRHQGPVIQSPPSQKDQAVIAAVIEIAAKMGRSPAEVSLAWLRSRRSSHPVIPILGASRVSQLRANLASLDLKLDDADMTRLDTLSAPELNYPLDILSKPTLRERLFLDDFDNHRER